MKHLGDITKIKGGQIPVVDVITGGSPCQDLSVAGKRAGLAGERSGLFMEQIRIIREMREHDRRTNLRTDEFVRPRWCIWENVEGCLSSPGKDRRGEDFAAVIEEFCKIVKADAAISVPDGGWWPHAGCVSGIGDDGTPFSVAWRLHDAQFWGVPQRRKRIALVADFGGFSAPEVLFERCGLHRDIEEKRGARETNSKGTKGSACTAGNGEIIAFKKSSHARHKGDGQGWEEATVSDTLNAFDNSESFTPTIVYENHSQDSRYKELGDVCETVSAKYGTGGNNQPLVLCIGNGQRDIASHITEDVSQTLNCMHDPMAVLVQSNEQKRRDWFVRRLTPTECSRLQGLPDGWVDIGDWVDSSGKKHREADSPKFKAIGNSIATPFWFWLLRRISAQYERPATLGSLFDGIGGFPYCWVRCNGTKSVLWASEIEEFPMAVTRQHFGDEDLGIEGDVQKYL